MRITCLQHVWFETPGYIEKWMIHKKHDSTIINMWEESKILPFDDSEMLIIMGGPMSVKDHAKYAWLHHEKKLIERYIEKNKVIIGICLGAQLIAEVLGARVYKNKYKEIGWSPVSRMTLKGGWNKINTLPDKLWAFHWHSETFDIPRSASRWLSNKICYNQGFVYGKNIMALQCHFEVTPPIVNELIYNCHKDISKHSYDEVFSQINENIKLFRVINRTMKVILDQMEEHCGATKGEH